VSPWAVSETYLIVKMTPTIEARGTIAQAGPRSRLIQPQRGGVRGAATTLA